MSVDITGVHYNFDAIGDEDALFVDRGGIKPDIHISQNQVDDWLKKKTIPEAEALINEYVDSLNVIVTPMGLIGDDYPQPLPPNAEIISNKYYQYSMFFAIHIFSLDPFKFVTRFRDARLGRITGDWWE